MDEKKKNIVFSEIIDNRINGYAIGISFLLISTFLLVYNTYFYWTWLTYLVGAVFGVIGIAGIATEIDKSKKIKGVGNLILGFICLGLWLGIFLACKNNPIINTFIMPFLIVGAYGFIRGLLELFFSIWLEIVNSNRSFTKITKAIFLFITQLCGLALTILNILKIFKLV